ncbi:uncharacterized protein BJ212DRAFT_1299698 [Suillus subaureus]|uniref:Uncharacterized protein n=1 Tax=Suillus subaureus TaxID=48587 RepID=A0A9P7EB57_9AGAM|nr:uncharacterized protein BJ212DRAFT_1299698 [Suillus subaureus]KAG1816423.1 hypothetical protein BJ212DRAFT_1299698 [Suillus subaureus]
MNEPTGPKSPIPCDNGKRPLALDNLPTFNNSDIHKFEIKRFKWSYCQTVNEHKHHAHAEASIQRCNPTIHKLVMTYNSLCGKLVDLIRQGKAPAGTIPPHSISPTGILQLNVDDDIWQDAGLDDYTLAPPGWLADENTHAAIKFQLEVDQCNEEGAHIICLDGTAIMDDSENDWESDDERENDELIDQLEEAALAET